MVIFTNKEAEVLVRLFKEFEDLREGIGSCDHSVGVCSCDLERLGKEAAKVLEPVIYPVLQPKDGVDAAFNTVHEAVMSITQQVHDICSNRGGKIRMSVPVDDKDDDIVIWNALNSIEGALRKMRQVK